MSRDLALSCRCGAIRGRVRNVSPETVNRVVCHCDDCQAYLHHLGRSELMDARGGTDIVQTAPSSMAFDVGTERIACLRLTPKGLYRWHAGCCKTPLGNTLSPSIPFVGLGLEAFCELTDESLRREAFGPPRGVAFGQYATHGKPEGYRRVPWRLIARSAKLMIGWKVRGQTWPHPFFERASGRPRYPITTLRAEEREALRARCGPNPSVFVRP